MQNTISVLKNRDGIFAIWYYFIEQEITLFICRVAAQGSFNVRTTVIMASRTVFCICTSSGGRAADAFYSALFGLYNIGDCASHQNQENAPGDKIDHAVAPVSLLCNEYSVSSLRFAL